MITIRNTPKAIALFAALAVAVALLAAVPATAEPELPDVRPPSVPDELRAELAEAPDGIEATVTVWDHAVLDDVEALGITGTRLRVLPMLLVPALTPEHLTALEALPGVRSIFPNAELDLHMEESLYTTKARDVWEGIGVDGPGVTGEGIEIAVIDTGAYGQHPDMGNLVEFCDSTIALTDDHTGMFCSPFDSATGNAGPAGPSGDPHSDARETFHHGSHVIGTIAGTGLVSAHAHADEDDEDPDARDYPHTTLGVAPDATIRAYAANVGPTLQSWQILASFDDITHKKLEGFNDVVAINNSWGGGTGSTYNPDSDQAVAFKAAFDAGILPVFSAGNAGPGHNTLGIQCVSPWVACVTANTKPDSMAGFSSVGRPAAEADTNLDGEVGGEDDVAPDNHDRGIAQALDVGLYRPALTAPGVDINSIAWYADGACTSETSDPDQCYVAISGTSMSGPHVTGATALIAEAFRMAHGDLPSPNQIIDILERSAVTIPGVPAEAQGFGRLDVPAAVALAQSYETPDQLTPDVWALPGTPTPAYADGLHPGAEATVTDTQLGCTEQESWQRDDGWGQHTVNVPEGAERLAVTIDWGDHHPGANLYLRLWRPGVDPDGLDEPPGPDRVFPDGEHASLVWVPADDPEFDGPRRTVTLPAPEDGEWTLRVYQRVSAGDARDCPADSDEDPERGPLGYTYDVIVETPMYVETPDVAMIEGDRDGDVQELLGTADYPDPLDGITTWEVPGTAPVELDDENNDNDDPAVEHVRVTDLDDALRIAWDGDSTGAWSVHRSTDPTFSPSSANRIAGPGNGAACQSPDVPSWPTASRDGRCVTDDDVAPGVTYYYRVVDTTANGDAAVSRLAYGQPSTPERQVRVKVDRLFGPGYWEYADPLNEAFTGWSHDWDQTGVDDPAEPLARSYQQGIGSATEDITDRDIGLPGAPRIIRLEGETRVQTAIAVSGERFDDADTVVIARSTDYPDALAGAPLATSLDAPILLTPSSALHPDTAAEIDRLGASTAVLLGGTVALSAQVEDALRDQGLAIDRIDGVNRFDTAARIAARLADSHTHAFIAEGDNPQAHRGWPDPLSAAPLAAHTGEPILLVVHGQVPTETAQALDDLDVADTTVVGGPVAVSDDVVAELDDAGHNPTRVFGATRYETSRATFDLAVDAGMNPDRIWLGTGGDWPDALAAGPTVASLAHTFLLVHPTNLDNAPPARDLLTERADTIDLIVLLGGPVAISDTVENQIRALFE